MNKKMFVVFFLVLSLFLFESTPQVGRNEVNTSIHNTTTKITYFNATRAFNLIKAQVEFGPRIPGSNAIENVRNLVVNTLSSSESWMIEFQNFSKLWVGNLNISLVNIICTPVSINLSQPYFLLLAHYDSRIIADMDPDPVLATQPVLGANDGASGVAVGLELGIVLREYHNISNFRIVLFDAEDQGGTGWDWIIGSSYFVSSGKLNLTDVSFAILFDMVGGKNAQFKREGHSYQHSKSLVNEIWDTAEHLGYNEYFIKEDLGKITDDHLPFIDEGVIAVDIIDDFRSNYKAWHTSSDTLDQISINTLEATGRTVETVLLNFESSNTPEITFTTSNSTTSINLIFVIIPLFLLTFIRFRRIK